MPKKHPMINMELPGQISSDGVWFLLPEIGSRIGATPPPTNLFSETDEVPSWSCPHGHVVLDLSQFLSTGQAWLLTYCDVCRSEDLNWPAVEWNPME